jgi:hypothetical protein
MKKNMSKNGLYIGIGAGMVLFVISGLLPGSFIGGSIGVNIARNLVGGTLETSLLPRLIVAVSMLFGVLVSGAVFLISASSLGWLIGYMIDAARSSRTVENQTAVDSN